VVNAKNYGHLRQLASENLTSALWSYNRLRKFTYRISFCLFPKIIFILFRHCFALSRANEFWNYRK